MADNPFADSVSLEKAVDMAKRKWSYNYSDYLTILKATKQVGPDITKIPQELELLIKNALLDETKLIVAKMEEKKKAGMPY